MKMRRIQQKENIFLMESFSHIIQSRSMDHTYKLVASSNQVIVFEHKPAFTTILFIPKIFLLFDR
jgi:hypothetical protein